MATMYLSTNDVATYGASVTKRQIGSSQIVTYQDWIRNALDPTIQGQDVKYTQLVVTLAVVGADEATTLGYITSIVNLARYCTINFSEWSTWYWDGVLKAATPRLITPAVYELVLEWECGPRYAAQVTETFNRLGSATKTITGNLETPAWIQISPTVTLATFTLGVQGVSYPFANLTLSKVYVLDTKAGTFTEDGTTAWAKFTGWQLPTLLPGTCALTASATTADISIKYYPRYV